MKDIKIEDFSNELREKYTRFLIGEFWEIYRDFKENTAIYRDFKKNTSSEQLKSLDDFISEYESRFK